MTVPRMFRAKLAGEVCASAKPALLCTLDVCPGQAFGRVGPVRCGFAENRAFGRRVIEREKSAAGARTCNFASFTSCDGYAIIRASIAMGVTTDCFRRSKSCPSEWIFALSRRARQEFALTSRFACTAALATFRAVPALLALLLVGCAGLMGSANTLPAAPASAAMGDYSYVIGAGDNLNIIVWRNPELSLSVPVRPDGKVSAPLVDELVAQGKTSSEVARDIEKKLSTYVRDPVVTVIVTSFVGPYNEQIRVVGEAAKPQFLPFKQKMTLLDVMIAVGGLTDFADGNGASILRSAEGNKQYAVRLKDLVKRGDVSANVEMRPGDILIIPQSFF